MKVKRLCKIDKEYENDINYYNTNEVEPKKKS